jgi:hypothetical protein
VSNKWTDEMHLMCEWDARQSFPKMADGMGAATMDFKNSYRSRVAVSDGSASTHAAANPMQQSFNSEMEEDEAISKSKIYNLIDNMMDELSPNSELDKKAILMLSLLKRKI